MTPSTLSSTTRRRDQRSHDISTADPFPLVTRSLLADSARLSAAPTTSVSQPLLSLILARKAINDAVIACNAAKRLHPGNLPIRARLDAVMSTLTAQIGEMPLRIANR